MANIIRCKLPDGIRKFQPFKVSDYRDFLLIRSGLDNMTDEEQREAIDSLTEDYFGNEPKLYRDYLFLKRFTSSIGKTKIPVAYECPDCGKRHKAMLNLAQDDLTNPVIEVNDLKLKFKFPEIEVDDNSELIKSCLISVEQNEVEYNWDDLDEDTKVAVIESIDLKTFEEIVKRLNTLYFVLTLRCENTYRIVYKDLVKIFKILVGSDEIFTFYKINHILSKNNYDINSIMNMIPVERGFALSLIEQDKERESQ
ncbi:gp51 baseplate hub assembly catalyst [Acinetobacter phage Ac42]|uniref:gp51 baseplate hub assembly catalyst n=1 Tax=Acinetobacter phage Ac42 TaxID=762660 RepID=UPI0001EBCDBC|nr:gp51 baseplate hub assembly catalyst [Acinetobacter phage Ac42]ADI96432.1 gp51 baseplate hub assembly catalyst [Acinetobacter phage Ac42]